MRKLLLSLAAATLLLASCSKSDSSQKDELTTPESLSMSDQRNCGAMEVLAADMQNDPTLAQRMQEIEEFTAKVIRSRGMQLAGTGIVTIPVVVNVLYRTASENISDAQIQSQIDVLNEDFNATNSDFTKTPALFSGVAANVGVQFTLAGVVRKYSSKRSWRTNNDMKNAAKGGIAATDPANNLNIWVVNDMGGILGYAQFPGGNASTDGVVIAHKYMGRIGTATSPYNLGRTATHEVGHWMNLRHIWGDATCGNDQVADTPQHNTSNGGCPAYPHYSTCTGTPVEMTMNYMDYTYDACMYMFSNGQKDRMLAVFATGGPRASFAN